MFSQYASSILSNLHTYNVYARFEERKKNTYKDSIISFHTVIMYTI